MIELRRGRAPAIGAVTAGVLLALTVAVTSASADPAPANRALNVGAYFTMSERAYLTTVRALLAGRSHAEQTSAQYIQGGKDICAQITGGATWADFLTDADRYDLDVEFHRAAIDAATATFCPEHSGFTG
jgi:hypothetical protein